MKPNEIKNIDKSQFEFVQLDTKLHDTKLETKSVGYYKDALNRFVKSKAAMAGAIALLILLLFSLIVPLVTPYDLNFNDPNYAFQLPKNSFLSTFGISTGRSKRTMNSTAYDYVLAMTLGISDYDGLGNYNLDEALKHEYSPISKEAKHVTITEGNLKTEAYSMNLDRYNYVGFKYIEIARADWERLKQYEIDTGRQVIYPMIDEFRPAPDGKQIAESFRTANYWYVTDAFGRAIKNPDGSFQEKYLRNEKGEIQYYTSINESGIKIRVLYAEYFEFVHGVKPQFFFGTNGLGQDLMIRLALGLRISFMLGFSVAIICFVIGAVIGALEGYYGGTFDLILERIIDIIAYVPFIAVTILFQYHFVITGKASAFVILMFTFVLTGWIGTAGLVRTQFYRFKSQEYILAARTLGAGDFRIMIKHIFPNTLGTIITSQALAIPGIIITEAGLAYLGVVKLAKTSSLGYMLADGKSSMATQPHVIMLPIVALILLILAFNLFGDGLRDAFNPALRGTDA